MVKIKLHELAAGVRFAAGLPGFFINRTTPEQAYKKLGARQKRRSDDFLLFVEETIYRKPKSPYFKLLDHAAVQFDDLRSLVFKKGVNGCLKTLFKEGVYLTLEEFKGRVPVVRGTLKFSVNPSALRNLLSLPSFWTQSSGSSGSSVSVPLNLPFVKERSIDHCALLDSRGGLGWTHAIWGVPGFADTLRLLELTSCGISPDRWFSQMDFNTSDLHPRYRLGSVLLRFMARLSGPPVPAPQHVPWNDPLPIVRWLNLSLERGEIPHLFTFVSPGVRICQTALSQKIEIAGSQFTVSGEPFTRARQKIFLEAGAAALPRMLASECGYIGYGCLKPRSVDDMHVIDDMNTVIAVEEKDAAEALPANSVLISSQRLRAPFVLLNVSLGDQAIVDQRSCGCPLEQLGWTTHISRVRSFKRLTAVGMTFTDEEVERILEDILPARFGGSPLDYQIIESEDSDGDPRITLVVSPSVGSVDEAALVTTFIESLGFGSGSERIMGHVWKTGNLVSIKRDFPDRTVSGKVRHVITE